MRIDKGKVLRMSLLVLAGMTATLGTVRAEEAVLFERDILPIFQKHCNACHSPAADRLKAGLDLSTAELVLKGSEYGTVIVAGNAEESFLIQTIEHKKDPYMPPPKQSPKLSDEEISLIRRWIDEGAKSGEGVSPKQETVKAVEAPATETEPTTSVSESAGGSAVASAAYSPDGKLFARGRLGVVELFEVKEDGALQFSKELPGHAESVRALSFSPDGTLLAAGGGKPGRNGEVILWDIAKGETVRRIEGHTDNILDLDFHPDGKTFATASYDKTVRIWSVESGEELHLLKDHVDAVFSVDFSPDGMQLASGAGDRTVKIWDAVTGERILTLSDSTSAVRSVAFAPSSHLIAAGAADKMIRVWDLLASQADSGFTQSALTRGNLVHSTFAHDGALLEIRYSPNGQTLYSTAQDRRIKAWDASRMTAPTAYAEQSDWVLALDLSPDGRFLAVGRYDGTGAVYSTEDGALVWSDGVEVQLAEAAAEPEEAADEDAGKRRGKDGKIHVDAVIIDATIPPIVESVSPDVWPRGATVEMTVRGRNLGDAEFYFTDNRIGVEVKEVIAHPVPEFVYDEASLGSQIFNHSQPYEVKLALTIPEDVGVGAKHLFAHTPIGLSNAQEFRISDRGDSGEVEPNDTHGEAQRIGSLPVRMVGSTNTESDVDRYRVSLAKGQEIVAVLADTGLNPNLRILSADGEELTNHREFRGTRNAHVAWRAEGDEEILIEVSDRDQRRGIGYRLHIGEFPYVAETSPLGSEADVATTVRVKGYNLGGVEEMVVEPSKDAPHNQKIGLPIPAFNGFNPTESRRLAVGAYTEIEETEPNDSHEAAQPLPFGATVNGRLHLEEGVDAADVYRFEAKEGEDLLFEVVAQQLGSPVDSFLEILDAEGALLERGSVRCIAQTVLTLSDRDSKAGGLRIDDWSDLRMKDHLMIGSEILQVRSLPDYADEDIVVEQHPGGQRKGFFGTTPEHHAVGTRLFKVEVHPPGTQFEPNGMPIFPLYWRNDDSFQDGEQVRDSQLLFTPPADGEYFVRITDTVSGNGPDHQYRLTLRKENPDFKIFANPYRINVEEGSIVPLTVSVRREDGFAGTIRVTAHDVPAGIEILPGAILEGQTEATLAVKASPRAISTERGSTIRISGTAEIGGEEVVRETRIGEIVVVKKQPDLLVNNGEPVLRIQPGESQWLSVNLERYNGYSSRTPIDVENLPYGVYVTDTGLNGILVREGETARSMQIYCEPWVKPMTHEIYIQARVEVPGPARLMFLGEPVRLEIGSPGEAGTTVAGTE